MARSSSTIAVVFAGAFLASTGGPAAAEPKAKPRQLEKAPPILLRADVWTMAHADDRITLRQGIAAAVVRRPISSRLWVQAGLGVAFESVELDDDEPDALIRHMGFTPAAVGGVGFDVLSTEHLAIDIELKAGSGRPAGELEIYSLHLGLNVRFE